MASGKITKRTIDALIASRSEGFLWDDGIKGFGAKITKSGAVSYILQFRMGGREARTRRCTIGSHGSPWTPTTAREEALRLSRLIGQGVDPVEVEKQRRREAVDLAFDNYADRFERSCVGRGWKLSLTSPARRPGERGKPCSRTQLGSLTCHRSRSTMAEAFDGQNELRTSLETFAIGAMFDQVLEAANLRLDPMTSGRYRFERDTVSVGGRSKRGLDVRVHGIETGRARKIITLSGGETFIAALSLALGLSDIVEMTNGAIRLDTIFIDEGFGSLDTENDAGTLDQVLQVLQNIVGERRAVGLISHVPLVQQAVPNGFTVHKGVNGSQIEVRVG